jgi:hypothetical protein
VDWIGLAQCRDNWKGLANTVMKFWVPKNSERLSSGYTTSDVSSSAQLHILS